MSEPIKNDAEAIAVLKEIRAAMRKVDPQLDRLKAYLDPGRAKVPQEHNEAWFRLYTISSHLLEAGKPILRVTDILPRRAGL